MTAPSLVLDRIAATLRTELGDAFSVDVHEGTLGADGKEFLTFRSPGVIVACLGWPSLTADDTEPGGIKAHFVAFCHARLPEQGAASSTSGKVAMDLAHIVTGIVNRERWNDEDGEPTVESAAERVRASNEYTNALGQKGLRIWAVQWHQEVALESATDTETLNRLAGLTMKFAVVDESDPDDNEFEDDTHDEQADVDFPEPTP